MLRSQLLASEFGGERLPDEADLMHEYGASRNVVRSALAELQRERLIDRKQGAGTFPIGPKWRHSLVEAHGLASSIDSSQLRMVTRAVGVERISAPPVLARELDVEPGADCIAFDMVTTIDGRPAVLLTSYVVDGPEGARIVDVVQRGIWAGDWYNALAEAGLPPVDRQLLIEAVAVDALVAPHLDTPVGAPVIRCERRLQLGDARVREYGFSLCCGDLVAFGVQDGWRASDDRDAPEVDA